MSLTNLIHWTGVHDYHALPDTGIELMTTRWQDTFPPVEPFLIKQGELKGIAIDQYICCKDINIEY